VLWAVGDWSGAESAARQALADGGSITTRITALHALGYVAMGRGAPATAVEHLTEATSLAAGMRELQRMSPAWWGLAEVALQCGDLDSAIARCEEGYEASARVRDAAYLYPYVITGVRAHLARSGSTAAREWLTRSGELVGERGIPGTLGALVHGRGLVHLHEGQTGKARDELATAAAFWTGRRRFWEGTAALADQARCALRSRKPAEATAFQIKTKEVYASAGAPVPANLLPREAVVPLSRPVFPALPSSLSAPASLSARELEVARLVAAGMTNREIAAELTIAPKTAAAHVEHIRTKLGVSRRAQIAAWVATLG